MIRMKMGLVNPALSLLIVRGFYGGLSEDKRMGGEHLRLWPIHEMRL